MGELCFILDIFKIITVHFIFQDVHLTLSKEWAIKGKISHLSYGLVQETFVLITKTDKLTCPASCMQAVKALASLKHRLA